MDPRQLNAQSDNVKPHEEPLVLLPLEVMVKPLELHFQYHFAGDRPTNKLDKVSFADRSFPEIHYLRKPARILSLPHRGSLASVR